MAVRETEGVAIKFLPTTTEVEGIGFLPPFVCVAVFPHDISNTDAARIQNFTEKCSKTSPGVETNLFWNQEVKGQGNDSRVTKTLPTWVFTLFSAGFF